jgi:hypothetical protein
MEKEEKPKSSPILLQGTQTLTSTNLNFHVNPNLYYKL